MGTSVILRPVHGPRGIVFSDESVDFEDSPGSLNLLEVYADAKANVPRDLVAEAVIRVVWERNEDGHRKSFLLEDVISARRLGEKGVCLSMKGLEEILVFSFRNKDAVERFFSALNDMVLLYELGSHSGTFAVEGQRRIRRVKRSLVEMDNFLSTPALMNVRQSPSIHLLRAFASITVGFRDTMEKLSQRGDEDDQIENSDSESKEYEHDISPPFPVSRSRKRGVPVSLDAWRAFIEGTKPIDSISVRHAIFLGGVAPNARPEIWPYIAKVFDWDAPRADQAIIEKKLRGEYDELEAKWKQYAEELDGRVCFASKQEVVDIIIRNINSVPASIHLSRYDHSQEDELENGNGEIEDESSVGIDMEKIRLHRSRILKDVRRTDREVDVFSDDSSPSLEAMRNILTTYAIYDPTTGYCQGMSDILAPIVYVYGPANESLSFWTFATLMKKLERNFRVDQTGIRAQLDLLRRIVEVSDKELADYFEVYDPHYYSCFRWILVQLKRELSFTDVLRLWEVLWLEHLQEDFQIYIVVGLLRLHKRNLVRLDGFDDLVRYINDMSMKIDIDSAIEDAVKLFKEVGPVDNVE